MERASKRLPADREERLRALPALVAELGSIAAACRSLGLDRSAWYRLQRTGGRPATASLPKSAELAPRVEGLALRYPEWGCDRIAHYLTLQGRPVSSPTVQKTLIRLGLGKAAARAAEAARRGAAGGNA